MTRTEHSQIKKTNQVDFFTQLSSFECLLFAFHASLKGCRNKQYALEFEYHQEQQLGRLSWELRTGRYCPSAYHHFTVSYPKCRSVAAPAFRDRVVQQVLISVIEPMVDRSFIYDSYACRKNKGSHFGAQRIKSFLKAVHTHFPNQEYYVLQADIKSYFASISWPILIALIKKKITQPETVNLISQFIVEHRVSTTSTQSQAQITQSIDLLRN